MTAHPLAELAAALDAQAESIDQAIEERVYVTPEVAAAAERRSIELRRTARVLRSLHPDVARVALALAEGLTVPDGWTVRMDEDGDLQVMSATELGWVFSEEGDWRLCGEDWHPTAQAAVDAAVEALGGPR